MRAGAVLNFRGLLLNRFIKRFMSNLILQDPHVQGDVLHYGVALSRLSAIS
jgi:hypothetical protein